MTSARDEPVRALDPLAVHEHAVRAHVAHHVAVLGRRELGVAARDLVARHHDVAPRIAADHQPALGDRVLLAVHERHEPAARRPTAPRGARARERRRPAAIASTLTYCVAPRFDSSAKRSSSPATSTLSPCISGVGSGPSSTPFTRTSRLRRGAADRHGRGRRSARSPPARPAPASAGSTTSASAPAPMRVVPAESGNCLSLSWRTAMVGRSAV